MAKTKSGRSDSKWIVEKHCTWRGEEFSGEIKRKQRRDERRKRNQRDRECVKDDAA